MNIATQHRNWILGLHGRAAGTVLALSIMLVTALFATRSAQAQIYVESRVHSFSGSPDGSTPLAGLIRDAQGNLYGTTESGGDPNCTFQGGSGCGTVFKVDATGNETVLHRFSGTPGDGTAVQGGLIEDAQGNLYGITGGGGAYGNGTVFKVDAIGNETVLYSFGSVAGDGISPQGGLTQDAQGNLYGATFGGGAYDKGTVFATGIR